MGTISPTQPSAGSDRGTEELDAGSTLSTIVTCLNGNIDAANAPTLKTQYRTVVVAGGRVAKATVASTILGMQSRNSASRSGVAVAATPMLVPYAAADYAVTGQTTKLNLRVAVITNSVAPVSNFTFGLYPVTTWGGLSTTTTVTVGTVTSGSTVAINAPPLGGITSGSSGDFTPPADGVYVLGCVTSAALTDSVGLWWQLEVRVV